MPSLIPHIHIFDAKSPGTANQVMGSGPVNIIQVMGSGPVNIREVLG